MATAGGGLASYQQVVEQGQTDSLKLAFKVDGEPVTADSATVSIYDQGGGILVADADCTIALGIISYEQEWAETSYDRGQGYKAVFSVVEDGTTYVRVQYFACVRRRFRSSLTDEILESRYTYLGELSLTTFKPWRDQAWDYITQWLYGRIQMYPGNCFHPEKFHDAHLYLTMAEFHLFNATSGNGADEDIWKEQRFRELGMERLGLAASHLDFDQDDDGLLDEEEKGASVTMVRALR